MIPGCEFYRSPEIMNEHKKTREQAIKIIRQLKELGTTPEEFEEHENQRVKNIIEKDPTQAILEARLGSKNDLKNKV